jgi:hypothetical protein
MTSCPDILTFGRISRNFAQPRIDLTVKCTLYKYHVTTTVTFQDDVTTDGYAGFTNM